MKCSPLPTLSLGRVLVVDDHAAARESVSDVLRSTGYHVVCAESAARALGLLENDPFDVVITDLQMPGMDGLEFIRQISRRRLPVQVLMITAHATITSAVEAMRAGAFDYLEKPFDITQLEQQVVRAIQQGQLLRPDLSPPAIPIDSGTTSIAAGMIGTSLAMRQLAEQIARVAPTDETVLVRGESGTGKELVARAIHTASRRSAKELISLNCPALPPQLAESELFGHLRGAFTGADTDRIGRFEMADQGTLLLDEITEIDLPLQAKLLRVLQEQTLERVGCSTTRKVDVRVIASTNRDLSHEVAAGHFRADLFFRLAVVPLELPPLRNRGEDIQLLADHFLDRAARRLRRQPCTLLPETRQILAQYTWPGNVRELENIITRACILNQEGPIAAQQLRPWLAISEQEATPKLNLSNSSMPCQPPGSTLPIGSSLDEVQRQMILATLEHFDGHRAKTAKSLGIGVRTLSGKLRSYGYAPHAKTFTAKTFTAKTFTAKTFAAETCAAETCAMTQPEPGRQILPIESADHADHQPEVITQREKMAS